MRHIRLWVAFCFLFTFAITAFCQRPAVSAANATVPPLVKFSGVLTDGNGKPLPGLVGVTFSLYKDEQGGSPLWLETQNVQPDKSGRYSVMLGSTTGQGLPADLFASGEARWVGVQAQGQAEQPRVLLLSVPYALKAADAETLGGKPASAFMAASSSNTPGTNNNSAPGVSGKGKPGYVPLWKTASSLTNSNLFQSSSNVGLGTTSPGALFDVNGSVDVRNTLTLFPNGSAPTLSVNGTAFNVSNAGLVSFVSGQTFPGAGTITGVAAGTDLTGGGTSGNVTLNLDTSKVPQLNTANTFTGNQTVNGAVSGTQLISTVGQGTAPLQVTSTTQVSNLNASFLDGLSASSFQIAGSYATLGANTFAATQTVSSGDVSIGSGNLDLPQTASASAGVVNLGGNPFMHSCCASFDTSIGSYAGNFTSTGNWNTATGSYALVNDTTGFENTANGAETLLSNTTGTGNTAVGNGALYANTTGYTNTGVGGTALYANTTGNYNTATGNNALISNTTGGYNTAAGVSSLSYNSTGNYNTATGFNAGETADRGNMSGSLDTFLGYQAVISTGTLSNATAIGANAEVSASNAMVLGSISGVNGANANTNVGIGTTSPAYSLDVHGTGNFTGLVTFAPGQTFPGTGTVASVGSGSGLTGGPITGSGTLSIATGGVSNTMLQNSSLTVTAGTDMTGGGAVSLGGTTTLNLDTTKVPQLSANNSFTGNQSVTGNVTATGTLSGGVVNASTSFNLGGNPFAIGSFANGNAFFGFSGNTTVTGKYNTATGAYALAADAGQYNTAAGSYALYANTTGPANTGSGFQALQYNTTGAGNTATGADALSGNSTGSANTATGYQALASNTVGGNTATGYQALLSNTTGYYNAASGYQALLSNTTGWGDTASGYAALQATTTGYQNTATGWRALYSNTVGNSNTADGTGALYYNTGGTWNTACGTEALETNTTGASNTASGAGAIGSNTTGSGNTAAGFGALESTTVANNNTAMGTFALNYITTGSNNTGLGYSAGPNPNYSGIANAAAIGALAEVDASNAMVLGSINGVNGATASTNVGIGTTTPTYPLHIGNSDASIHSFLRVEGPAQSGTKGLAASFGGYGDFQIDAVGNAGGRFWVTETGNVGIGTGTLNGGPDNLLTVNGSVDKPGGGSWGTYSDRRLKTLDGSFRSGLSQVLKLNPVRYRYKQENAMGIRDHDEHIGLVAQEVQKVIPEAVTENSRGYLLLNNDPIIWTMLNAIKEQQREITSLREKSNRQPASAIKLASPDMTNVYNGNVTTNRHGLAVVVLPGDFGALNRDFRYQLTVIGQFAQAIVGKEISHNYFTIRTSRPGVKVSWQVTAIRSDAAAGSVQNAALLKAETEQRRSQ